MGVFLQSHQSMKRLHMFSIMNMINLEGRVTKMGEIKLITPEEVEIQLNEGKTLNIIDVREDDEVAEGMIPKAVHIKMGDIPDQLDQLDKNTEYVLVCRSGGRSGRVCEYLMEQGFNVTNMVGGMLEWTGHQEPKQ